MVQDILSRHVFVSRDVVFEEGQPHHTSPSVGKNNVPLFDTTLGVETLDEDKKVEEQTDQSTNQRDDIGEIAKDQDQHINNQHVNNQRAVDIPAEPIPQAIR